MISALIYTLNNANELPRLLGQLKDIVDEIVVIDSLSIDGTPKIARDYGARVYSARQFGYPEPLKHFGLSKVSNDWVLTIDADEILSFSLVKDLRKLIEEADNNRIVALELSRINVFDNKVVRILDNWHVRIYKRQYAEHRGLVHEQPIIRGRIKHLPSEKYYIIHFLPRMRHYFLNKSAKYAYFEKTQYDIFVNLDLIRKILRELGARIYINKIFLPRLLKFLIIPIYFPLLYTILRVFQSMTSREKIRTLSDLQFIVYRAFYATLVSVLKACRSKSEDRMAEMSQKVGLIKLMKLDKEENVVVRSP